MYSVIMTSLSVEHNSVNLGQVNDLGFCTAVMDNK